MVFVRLRGWRVLYRTADFARHRSDTTLDRLSHNWHTDNTGRLTVVDSSVVEKVHAQQAAGQAAKVRLATVVDEISRAVR